MEFVYINGTYYNKHDFHIVYSIGKLQYKGKESRINILLNVRMDQIDPPEEILNRILNA